VHLVLALSRGGRGLRALARAQLAALERVADPSWRPERAVAAVPTAGVRAGNAAPRRSADESVDDPLVATVLGLRPPAGWSTKWDECAVCGVARGGAEDAVAVLADARALPPRHPGATTPARAGVDDAGATAGLCARHGWLAVDRVGAAATRAALAPALDRLSATLAAVGDELAGAESVGLGPFAFSPPGARRARAELARRLAPPRGCSVCDAQAAAEAATAPTADVVTCRAHGRAPNKATIGHWRALLADLDEYVRKNDYRFRDEPRGDEQRSPWRAVAAVTGGPGLR
jgi:hypothetical protein